jgi:hypothetical protein
MRALWFIAFCSAVAAHADVGIPRVTRLAPADRVALEHPASIRLLYSVRGIPASVRSACATVISDRKFWLADPRKPYNEGCDADDRIPDRRLIWAARLQDRFVVHYESGGLAHSFHIIVVGIASSRPRVVWRAAAGEYKDYSTFVSALRRNRLFDYYDYKF